MIIDQFEKWLKCRNLSKWKDRQKTQENFEKFFDVLYIEGTPIRKIMCDIAYQVCLIQQIQQEEDDDSRISCYD